VSPQHTPTPWKVGRNLDHGLAIFTDQPTIRELVAAFKNGTVSEADAAFILRACNVHEQLFTALDELIQAIDQGDSISAEEFGESLTEARSALAAARGES
jgi:hypothetical protein